MQIHSHPDHFVAVIGAGPAGLTTARWLLTQGLEPILFEASARVGGQWNGEAPTSGTWAGMRTNTSRIMTAFSDLEYPAGTATYPSRDEVQAYLARYADHFGLTSRIRFRTRIERLSRAAEGRWHLRSVAEGRPLDEVFARVVVATGRHVAPEVPQVAGLDSFTGSLGVFHAAHYDESERFRGASVLVAGCSISALEIATELAQNGVQVTTAYRRQRYVLPKLAAGVPTEHIMFHRAAALAGEILPPEALGEGLKAAVLRLAGSPEQFGGQTPDPNIFVAGITQSHGFLPAVAEGRIRTRAWIERIQGQTVHFADGSRDEFDAILFGTGYRLSLPWLSPDISALLDLDGARIDLHAHTFHPDLPGLAFVGLYDLVGPYFPVLEQQARWLAYAWGGTVPAPTPAEMQAGIAATRAARGHPQSHPMNAMAVLFARLAGVEPQPADWPDLERGLLFGPLSAVSFRLTGPDALPDAPKRTRAAAAAFGRIVSSQFEPEEHGLRDLVRGTLPRVA
jgi:cation diffusion facilitator CzcD-associated flavoprotein CzcO